ncbi:hypothetical protein WOLCODRAFT_80859 [Wolfiporia cocos MD-104 SS10]|uniref:Helicase n=1 Tax=Wolfiporia cocos (strain MD-104) TaxID=742152 RepID=A0A2H3IZR0_WOLCO|nr:hypothetical protein WOLCODRAFT_80859 [Wolfiporia cocos MD-104 SS10]
MTINKAQGQSARYIGLHLHIPVFTHGQLYVALSRATPADHIKVVLTDNVADCSADNIVYHEVLLD